MNEINERLVLKLNELEKSNLCCVDDVLDMMEEIGDDLILLDYINKNHPKNIKEVFDYGFDKFIIDRYDPMEAVEPETLQKMIKNAKPSELLE